MAKKTLSLDPNLVRKILLDSTSTLDFLQKYFQMRTEILGKPGYSTFSQRAGFSSRSHIRDILTGRVKITNASMTKIAKALGFKDELLEVFFLKGKIESLDDTQGSESLNQILQFLKQKIEIESFDNNNEKLSRSCLFRVKASVPMSRYEEFKKAFDELIKNFASNPQGGAETFEVACELSQISKEEISADSAAS